MNLSNIHSCFLNAQNSVQSSIFCCNGYCVRKHQVHPEAFIPKDLEFVNLGSQRVIRVLHLPPQESIETVVATNHIGYNSLNCELRKVLEVPAEEYWFIQSNRPFKVGDVCDCTRDMPTSKGKISKVWRDVTDCFSEKIKTSCGSSESDVRAAENVFQKFAENLVQVALDEVCGTVLNQRWYNTSTVESKTCNPDNNRAWYRESTSKNSVSLNDDENFAPQGEMIVQVHRGNIDILEDTHVSEKDSCDSRNDIEALAFSCRSGIVNLSFSGSICEPDDLVSPSANKEEIVHSSQSKVDVSSGIYEKQTMCSLGGVSTSSAFNKNLGIRDSRITVTDGNKKSEELLDCLGQGLRTNLRKDSLLNDDSANVLDSNIVQLKFSSGHIDAVCVGDPMDSVTERKADMECCWHSKTIQKPSLLFLHGAGSSADIWSSQLQYFSFAGYEVIAPDMLGHGYSSAPDSLSAYVFDRLLEDVLQIFDKFILEHKKCVIIGHSYGSSFAAAVARYRPQQVVQLVLLSSGGPSPLVPKNAFFSFPSCIMSLMRPFLMCGFKRDLFYGPRGKHLHPCCTYELPSYVLNYVERGQEWAEGDAAFHRRITVPTLLVHGLKDPYISLVEECEMERTIPRSFLEVISNAGHMLMLDTPEQLCHMIHRFITYFT